MALVLDERWDSRTASLERAGANDTVDLVFFLYDDLGRDDIEDEIDNLLNPDGLAALPATYLGRYWYQKYSLEILGAGNWLVTATYAPAMPLETVWTGDTTGGTQHITQSIRTITKAIDEGFFGADPDKKKAIDFKGAIGVNGETVAGCDIVIPALHLTATAQIPKAMFTLAYEDVLFQLTGRVNAAAFRGRLPRELLFLGATYTVRKELPHVETVFKFAGSPRVRYNLAPETPTEASEPFIGGIQAFDKEGWDYLWIRYSKRETGPAAAPNSYVVHQPVQATVERVYRAGDFSLLGLGDGT